MAIQRSGNSMFSVAALLIVLGLLASVVYGIVFASRSLIPLFESPPDVQGEIVHFNLERAEQLLSELSQP